MSALRPAELLTSKKFIEKTDITFCGRGTELQAIDTALLNYEQSNHADHQVMVDRLGAVLLACETWIQAKQQKQSKNNQKRKGKIDELASSAWALYNWEKFASRKAVHAVLGNIGFAPKALDPGYQMERTLFANLKVQGNLAGTQTQINPVGGSFVHEAHPNSTLAATPLANLTDLDWLQIHTELHHNHNQMGARVHMIRKDERLKQNFVAIRNGMLYYREALLTTPRPALYAMDEYGNLLIQNPTSDVPGQRFGMTATDVQAQFNHSSLNAGKSVICAGMLQAANGLLTHLDTISGHYKPTRQNLHDCLHVLWDEEGVNLNGTHVYVGEPALHGGIVQPCVVDLGMAPAFMANVNLVGVALHPIG